MCPELLNDGDVDSCTPLYAACSTGALSAISVLLAAGADPCKASVRRSPLHVATCIRDAARRDAAYSMLLASGARPDQLDAAGETAAAAAERRGIKLTPF